MPAPSGPTTTHAGCGQSGQRSISSTAASLELADEEVLRAQRLPVRKIEHELAGSSGHGSGAGGEGGNLSEGTGAIG